MFVPWVPWGNLSKRCSLPLCIGSGDWTSGPLKLPWLWKTMAPLRGTSTTFKGLPLVENLPKDACHQRQEWDVAPRSLIGYTEELEALLIVARGWSSQLAAVSVRLVPEMSSCLTSLAPCALQKQPISLASKRYRYTIHFTTE